MLSKPVAVFLLFFSACIFTRCGTIIHGSRQNIIIVSEPNKANISINGMNVGITPYSARLKRNERHTIKVHLDGYNTYEVTLQRNLDGWVFGNILFGGIIGLVVDVATGSMYRLSPNDILAEIKRNTASSQLQKDQLYIAATLTPHTTWEKIGQLEKSTR